jgi:gliding motility-associated-like protein
MYKVLSRIKWSGICFFLLLLQLVPTRVSANCININSSFTPSQTLICGPGATTITFTNTSTGTGAAAADYAWYLNGVLFDNTSGLAAPSGSNISAIGTYTYMLVASDASVPCSDTATVQVIIRPQPVANFTFTPNNQCAGTTVNFSNVSTGTGGFTTYAWNFGDASTSTLPSPSHVYAAGGTYNVTLTVTNGTGCSSTFSQTVTVLPRPVAAIAGDDGDGDTQYCLSPVDNTTTDPVTFYNLSTGAVSYTWTFGDGSPAFTTTSTASFVHTYTSYGTFPVTMTATGANGCTTTTTLSVVFDKFVSASFVVPLAQFSGCVPHTVLPVNASQNASMYVWNFGDGSPTVTTTSFVAPSHTYTAGGSYTISVVASNSCNSSTSTVGPITVVGPPVVNFTATPALGCSPQVVTFGNTTTGASPTNNFYWDFGNGNTLNGVKFPPAQTYYAGTWTIMMISGNACGTDTMYRTIVVDTIPTAIMTATPLEGCTPVAVTTTNASTGGNLFYQWYIDGVLTYTSATIPVQNFTAPAGNSPVNHTIHLHVYNHCGVDDTTVTITVHPLVTAAITPASSTICAGSSVSFTQTSQGDMLTYAWDFGNGSTFNGPSPPAQTYAAAGTYTVTLTVTGFCGTATATATVIVNPIPVVPVATDANICSGSSAVLIATAPGGTYQWFNAPTGGTLLFTGASYTTPALTTTTQYYVQTTVLGCTSPRTIVTVTVNPAPVAPTALGATICAGQSAALTATAPGGSYEWYSSATGGALLGTGTTYNSPPLATSTTYYVQSVSAGCAGPRTAVTVVVNPVPAAPTVTGANICEGSAATLNATAPGGTYQWFDSLSGGTLVHTGSSFTTAALANDTSFYVQTTVAGCTGPRAIVNVTVNDYPVADISASAAGGCAGLDVTFNNNSTLGGTYSWTFAGGSPASSSAYTPPVISFNSAGTFLVQMNVTVAGCSSSDSLQISVSALPVPAFTVSPAAACSPLLASITNLTTLTAGDSCFWNLGNGVTTSLVNPPAQAYTAGAADQSYTVELFITAANGCQDSVSQTLTVHANPVASFIPLNDTMCAGASVAFTNTSSGAGSFAWNFGDGSSSATASPSHVFTLPGTYATQLIASTAFGCADTSIGVIVVDPVPVAAFSSAIECFSFPTQFDNTSTGTIVAQTWSFGDGSATDTNVEPSHIYPAAGTYNATLTVTNSFGCSDSQTNTVIVNSVPVAAFTANAVCAGQAMLFDDQSSGTPAGWSWDFGDGSAISNLQDPSHTYPAAGTYTVTLIASGGSGCTDTISNIVTVNPVPAAAFVSASVCANDTMFFSQTSAGLPDTFVWNFGDGSSDNSNSPDIAHVYSVAGTYNVVLTAGYASTGCTNQVSVPVTVYPLTVPSFTASTACLNNSTTFTDLSAGSPVSWQWNFGDGSPSVSIQNPSHIYASSGTFPVTLVTTNVFGCSDSTVVSATVNPLPVAAFVADTICAGNATSFSDQSVSAVSWSWNFGDGNVDATSSPTHVYSSDGSYSATLIVQNMFGCADTVSQTVIVNPNPVSLFSASTACYSYPTVFTDLSTSAVSWDWQFGEPGASSAIPSPDHTYANPGSYTVDLVVTNIFGCTNESSQVVTVLPQPEAAFSFNTVCARQEVQFSDNTTGTGLISWSWDFGDGGTSSIQEATHTYALGGIYTVTMIAVNTAGCADTVTTPIIVNTVPTPLFSANTSCAGTATTFTDLSSDTSPITNWFYDFDDGNNSLSQNPSYIYAGAGTYDVSLTVTNAEGCDSTVVIPVTVNVYPVASYSVDTVCIGTPTNFADLSSGLPSSWTWNFGDGVIESSGPTTSHVYGSAGSFLTSLTVSSGAGCTDEHFQIVVVRDDVEADILAAGSICEDQTLTINDNSTTTTGFIASQTWDFGDGSAGASTLNTSHTYNTPGTYIITHTVTSDGGCTSMTTDTVAVNGLPSANFSAASTCETQISPFTDLSTGAPGAWDWSFGDGGNSSLQNPGHVYASAGLYTATLIVTTPEGCADTTEREVVVHARPVASFSSDVVCWGDTTQFTNSSSSTEGAITSVMWEFGDGTSSSLFAPSHVWAVQSDTFSVTLIVTTSFGCNDTVNAPAYTHPIPEFSFSPALASGCDAFTTSFSDNSTVTGGSIVNWLWNFGDGNLSFAENPSHTYDEPGNYFVALQVTSSYGCVMADTLNFPVVVYPTPVAGFTAQPSETNIYEPEITFDDTSTGSLYYTYSFGDNETSTFSDPVHSYTDTGTYMVTQLVVNEYGCRDSIEHPIRINGETMTFIPNAFTPNSNGLNDVFKPALYGVIEFEMLIFDRWGNQIFRSTDQNEGWNGRFNGVGQELMQDVYVYHIMTKDLLLNSHRYIGSVTLVR